MSLFTMSNEAIKQTIYSTIFSYLGVFLGTFYTIFIIPKVFSSNPEDYGGLLLVINYVNIFLIVSLFSSPNTLVKFYPSYNQKDREDLISFLIWNSLFGLLIAILLFHVITYNNPIFVKINNIDADIKYFFYPLIIIQTLNGFLSGYCMSILRPSIPAFLRDSFTRFWMFLSLILLYYKIITFEVFIYLFISQYLLSLLLLLIYIYKRKKEKFKIRFTLPKNYKTLLNYSFFTLLTGAATTLITKIDIQMIQVYLKQEDILYYSYGIFFLNVLYIPSASITNVTRTIVSRDLKLLSPELFKIKFQRINLAQFTSTLIVFIGIFICIDELMLILGDEFGSNDIRWVILILCGGRLIESLFITNYAVISYSKYYKYDVLFQLMALVLVVILNISFIPIWGLIGAAISSSIVFIITGFSKSIFMYKKLKLFSLNGSYAWKLFSISLLILIHFLPIKNLLSNLFSNIIYNNIFIIFIKGLFFLIGLLFIGEVTGLRKDFFKFKLK